MAELTLKDRCQQGITFLNSLHGLQSEGEIPSWIRHALFMLQDLDQGLWHCESEHNPFITSDHTDWLHRRLEWAFRGDYHKGVWRG